MYSNIVIINNLLFSILNWNELKLTLLTRTHYYHDDKDDNHELIIKMMNPIKTNCLFDHLFILYFKYFVPLNLYPLNDWLIIAIGSLKKTHQFFNFILVFKVNEMISCLNFQITSVQGVRGCGAWAEFRGNNSYSF